MESVPRMECPHCARSLPKGTRGRCPQCGRPVDLIGIVRTSQVRVAAGEEDRVYGSIEDVPAEWQRQIRRALNGPYADTIVIADEGGRRRIFETIRGLPPDMQKKVLAAIRVSEAPRKLMSFRARLALAAGLTVLAGIVAALIWM